MQLHELKPKYRKYKKPPVGRGGKRGTFSGRGTKGQKARAGHRIRPAIRDFIQRLPKFRGFKNRSLKHKFNLRQSVVNLDQLSRFPQDSAVTPEFLKKEGFVKNLKHPIKILGRGEIKKGITFLNIEVSKSARVKIEAAGGRVENRKK